MAVPNIKLNSGFEMPQVGFGLWKVDNAIAADTVYEAIKAGYRLFDGACDYGNEVECGQGVARAIKEGIVKREELFLVSKLWNTFHDGDRVEPIVRKQLADWGIDYFDLYLIHFPVALEYVDPSVRYPPGWHYDGKSEIRPSKASIQETWTAMESLAASGLSKSIGVSNFQGQLLYDLLRYAKIPPATLQIEHHPYLVQPDLIKLAANEGIAVTAYSSFGPASFKEFNMEHATDFVPLFEEPTVSEIAKKHGKTNSQVLLRWATQRGLAVIPKTSRKEILAQNLDCTSFDLEQSEIDKISSLDRKTRFNQPANYFPTEKLWIFG
ncbi:NAD(P)H-dependent D-xylose reductase XYR1 [Colletotrichum aenigma]|uniref:NAD(P)H-dependent D-xylose reductase XYR1 n=1 Tax=Colletotrichum aenigma TaxID=1215731 RepID=UPI001872C305|nr:NAD(P)H-dependent D-xylose reductase XYR1 [Colletotrichum aenigma]KAF5519239.1 NAD(P)H-dependent D-xylose reductase XYR1 [Colletotrichum aenigma]